MNEKKGSKKKNKSIETVMLGVMENNEKEGRDFFLSHAYMKTSPNIIIHNMHII